MTTTGTLTIIGDNIESVECIKSDINNITAKNQRTLKQMIVYDNNINNISLQVNENFQKIIIHNNPIATNTIKLMTLLESLPDRNNKAWGSIVINDVVTMNEIENNYIEKDWYFGSVLPYTEPEKISDKLLLSGIPDIWESAEYGEGMTSCIMDCGIHEGVSNINWDNSLGGYNVADNNSIFYIASNELSLTN